MSGGNEAEEKLQERLTDLETQKAVLDRQLNEAKEKLEIFIINA